MAADDGSVTGFVVDSDSDSGIDGAEEPAALDNAALGHLWNDVKRGASPPKRARLIGIPQGETVFEVDELRRRGREERVLPETGEWRETWDTDEGGRFETNWRNEEAERIAILEKNPDYKFIDLVAGHAGRPAHRLYDDDDVDRAIRERRVGAEQRRTEAALAERAALLRARQAEAEKAAEQLGKNVAQMETYLNTGALFRLARQHRQAAEEYATAKTSWEARARLARAEISLLDVLLEHTPTGITSDDIDPALLCDVAPSVLSNVEARSALPPGAVAAAVGGDRARTAAMFSDAIAQGGTADRVEAARAAARFVTLRTLWQVGRASEESGSELSLAIAENRAQAIQRALDERRGEARSMLIGVLSEGELDEGEGALLVRFLDTASNIITRADAVVWDGAGVLPQGRGAAPTRTSVLDPAIHGVAGAEVMELVAEWRAKIADASASVREGEDRATAGPKLAAAVRPYVRLGGGEFLEAIGALRDPDVPDAERAVLRGAPPRGAFYGAKMFEIYAEHSDDLAAIDAAVAEAGRAAPDFGENERAAELFNLMEAQYPNVADGPPGGRKLFLEYETRLVRAHVQMSLGDKIERRRGLFAEADALGAEADKAELPEPRYQHRRAWVERPEHSGIIRLDSVVNAAIDDAFRLVQYWVPWGKDVDVEFLQHDPAIRGDFAKLVALRIAPATQIFPTTYKQLGVREIVDRDIINVMQRMMRGYDIQSTGETALGAPRHRAELRPRAQGRRGAADALVIV